MLNVDCVFDNITNASGIICVCKVLNVSALQKNFSQILIH